MTVTRPEPSAVTWLALSTPASTVTPPVKSLDFVRVSSPVPCLTIAPVLAAPKPRAVPKLTLFAPTSTVAVAASAITRRPETSFVLLASQRRAEVPDTVIRPVPARAPEVKPRIPALMSKVAEDLKLLPAPPMIQAPTPFLTTALKRRSCVSALSKRLGS